MNRVVITGADGFVGSYTVNYFLKKEVEVLAIDKRDTPSKLKPHKKLTYRQCNMSNIDKLKEFAGDKKYDTLIHFAWSGSSGEGRFNYELQMKNVLMTVECLKAAKDIGCKRFVCAGSIMEYEAELVVHQQESHPGMGYIYGIGKMTAHCICKSVAAEIGIELLWPLITNTYGAGEMSPRFINTTLRKILKGEPLKFTSATQNYDFVYVTDVARAFYLVALKGKPFCEYLIGSSKARPLREFIEELHYTVAPKAELNFGDIPYTGINLPLELFDTSAIERDCGFMASVTFSEGILKTMEWLNEMGGYFCST